MLKIAKSVFNHTNVKDDIIFFTWLDVSGRIHDKMRTLKLMLQNIWTSMLTSQQTSQLMFGCPIGCLKKHLRRCLDIEVDVYKNGSKILRGHKIVLTKYAMSSNFLCHIKWHVRCHITNGKWMKKIPNWLLALTWHSSSSHIAHLENPVDWCFFGHPPSSMVMFACFFGCLSHI